MHLFNFLLEENPCESCLSMNLFSLYSKEKLRCFNLGNLSLVSSCFSLVTFGQSWSNFCAAAFTTPRMRSRSFFDSVITRADFRAQRANLCARSLGYIALAACRLSGRARHAVFSPALLGRQLCEPRHRWAQGRRQQRRPRHAAGTKTRPLNKPSKPSLPGSFCTSVSS